jgi:succinyl-diaminopimelate desuccinylase
MSRTLQLTEQLISLPSVTPEDAGCLELLADALTPMGFTCERLDSGPADFRVQNLWAKRSPTQNQSTQDAISSDRPVLVFAGHTDVVPPGPLKEWTSPPFVPMHRDGKLYGRGASDMKTSIAAFVVALEEFLQATPEPAFDIALLLTSDEEGPRLTAPRSWSKSCANAASAWTGASWANPPRSNRPAT